MIALIIAFIMFIFIMVFIIVFMSWLMTSDVFVAVDVLWLAL